jgi:hypothetical protein
MVAGVGLAIGWATGVIFDVFLAGFTKEKPRERLARTRSNGSDEPTDQRVQRAPVPRPTRE